MRCGPSFRLPTGPNLSAGQGLRHRSDHRTGHADDARFPDGELRRSQAGRGGREHSQPHAGRAAGLQELEADFRDVVRQGGSSFRRVGLVEFPSPGMWSLVFLSNPASADIAAKLPETEHVAAFMPCTPNPTTGFFFYVPRRDVIDLDITVEAAMTLLMSAGMVQPGANDQQKKLAALAETARLAQAAQTSRRPHRQNSGCRPFSPFGCVLASTESTREAGHGFHRGNLCRIPQLRELFRTRYSFGVLVLGPIRCSRVDRRRFDRHRVVRIKGSSAIESLVGLALFLPGLAVSVRRLHDLDRSGWWVLIGPHSPRRSDHTDHLELPARDNWPQSVRLGSAGRPRRAVLPVTPPELIAGSQGSSVAPLKDCDATRLRRTVHGSSLSYSTQCVRPRAPRCTRA